MRRGERQRRRPAGSDTGNTTIERADSLGELLHQVTAEKSEEKRIAKNGVSHTVMSEDKNKAPLYYPRKMRTGWCVAHEVTAAGVTIERYGIHCQTYAEAYRRAEVMNRKQEAEVEAGRAGTEAGEVTDSLEPSVSGEKGGGWS